jgi:Na+/H+ antiporter NhaD/arsenite permease-like protein
MTTLVIAIFGVVYLGMILGGLPRLYLDRTGVALLGAIAIVGFGVMTPEQAAQAVHLPTILLLFSFMVISAVRLGVLRRSRGARALPIAPAGLLGVVTVVAVLSAVYSRTTSSARGGPGAGQACVRHDSARCLLCWRWPVPPTSDRPRR